MREGKCFSAKGSRNLFLSRKDPCPNTKWRLNTISTEGNTMCLNGCKICGCCIREDVKAFTGVTGSVSEDDKERRSTMAAHVPAGFCSRKIRWTRLLFSTQQCHPKHRLWWAVREGYNHLHICWERMSGMQPGKKFQHLLP